ncbi:LCP family protein [Streptomyces sp. KR80]|uniref:LCP family protein n=1 Tax=Streptomyces sp. KR80 TaxID=3457426 RepID=UPI003FD4045D
MTDTAGTPDAQGDSAAADPPGGPSAAADAPRESDAPQGPDVPSEPDTPRDPERPRRRAVRWGALAVSLAVLAAAGVGWMMYRKLEGNITTDTGTAEELKRYEAERPASMVHNAENILLIGSDTRADDNGKYGRDTGTQRSDTTILLHLAADRKSATAVSIPRDLMTDIPACLNREGKETEPRFAQFNTAFELAGPACTIRTAENLTGIRIDHHMIVDFAGFTKMVDAVDGVDVCLKDPIDDAEAHLELPAGRQKLDGEQALGYVRARYSIGNGSDTERMDRQQQFLGSLVKKVQSDGVLLNPTKLYPVLDAMTSSLTTDPGLDSLRELYELVRSLRGVPADQVRFLTMPRRPYSLNANRDELVQPAAAQLFNLLRNDLEVTVEPHSRRAEAAGHRSPDSELETMNRDENAASDAPSGEPTPTYRGTTAALNMCG